MMGYETPNIDRIAKGGMFFTDAYGEQSCTAGRAAFEPPPTRGWCRRRWDGLKKQFSISWPL